MLVLDAGKMMRVKKRKKGKNCLKSNTIQCAFAMLPSPLFFYILVRGKRVHCQTKKIATPMHIIIITTISSSSSSSSSLSSRKNLGYYLSLSQRHGIYNPTKQEGMMEKKKGSLDIWTRKPVIISFEPFSNEMLSCFVPQTSHHIHTTRSCTDNQKKKDIQRKKGFCWVDCWNGCSFINWKRRGTMGNLLLRLLHCFEMHFNIQHNISSEQQFRQLWKIKVHRWLDGSQCTSGLITK